MLNGSGSDPDTLNRCRYPVELLQNRRPLGLSIRASVQKSFSVVPAVQLACTKPLRHSSPSTITSNPFQIRESSGACVCRMSPVENAKAGSTSSYIVVVSPPLPGSRASLGAVKVSDV